MPTQIFLCLALLTASCVTAFAQTPAAAAANADNKNKTELELFQEKYGSVIVKGFSDLTPIVGTSGSFQFTLMEFRNPSSASKVKGLVAEVDPAERYSSSVRSFIEYGEIDSLIKGITYISKIDKTVTTLQNFEARYATKGEFTITVFNSSAGETRVALTVGRIGAKSIFVEQAALATLVTQLQQAKASLDAL